MGKASNKRNSDVITPPNIEPKRTGTTGMSAVTQSSTQLTPVGNMAQTPYGVQNANANIPNMSNMPISPMFPYSQYPLYHQSMMPGFAPVPQSPVTTDQGTPIAPSQSYGARHIDSEDMLSKIISRLDKIDDKLCQLDKITVLISKISDRLSTVENKCNEIEKSQLFIDSKYESITKQVDTSISDVAKLKCDVSKLRDENKSLKQINTCLGEDVIDLKCRSMRDNLLFFGIKEDDVTAPPPQHDAQLMTNASHLTQSRGSKEDCTEKVLQFCQSVLHIENPGDVLQIDRSHRIGNQTSNKTRPIVVRFKDTNSKLRVKDALRGADLRSTPFNVADQYPTEVLERRKVLVEHMVAARREGKRAVLVRDKLYINNRLFQPPASIN